LEERDHWLCIVDIFPSTSENAERFLFVDSSCSDGAVSEEFTSLLVWNMYVCGDSLVVVPSGLLFWRSFVASALALSPSFGCALGLGTYCSDSEGDASPLSLPLSRLRS